MTKKIIAIDGDGVMLDYNQAFKKVYEKEFKVTLTSVLPNAYHAHNEFGFPAMTKAEKERFYMAVEEHQMWRSMPALDGAIDQVNAMADLGYKIVCLTSMPKKYQDDRLYNLQSLGFKVDEVVATERTNDQENPKLDYIVQNKPYAFIDDLLKNFKGCEDQETQLIFLQKNYPDDPNKVHQHQKTHMIISHLSEYTNYLKEMHHQLGEKKSLNRSHSASPLRM